MREHLYRGKRIDNGEWVEAECYNHYKGSGIWKDSPEKEIYFVGGFACHAKTICEFSGLWDIRSKRIFEDDLLKDDNGFVYRVVFEYGAFCLVAVTEFNIPYDTLPKDPDLDEFEGNLADNIVPIYVLKWNNRVWHNSFEIIGNIHDNPELLKED